MRTKPTRHQQQKAKSKREKRGGNVKGIGGIATALKGINRRRDADREGAQQDHADTLVSANAWNKSDNTEHMGYDAGGREEYWENRQNLRRHQQIDCLLWGTDKNGQVATGNTGQNQSAATWTRARKRKWTWGQYTTKIPQKQSNNWKRNVHTQESGQNKDKNMGKWRRGNIKTINTTNTREWGSRGRSEQRRMIKTEREISEQY